MADSMIGPAYACTSIISLPDSRGQYLMCSLRKPETPKNRDLKSGKGFYGLALSAEVNYELGLEGFEPPTKRL